MKKRKKSTSALFAIDRRKLAVLMAERELNNIKLAELMGVSHQAVGQLRRWDGGCRESTIGKVARALGVSPDLLMSNEPVCHRGHEAVA